MKFSTTALLASLIPAAVAQSTSTIWVEATATDAYDWSADWNPDIQIHTSCNQSQYKQIWAGWKEAQTLAAHARDHTSRWGNDSSIYRKYFGEAPTAEVVGWYDGVVNADKTGMLFRCDNIDGNCALEGWAGHSRGENATDETVICDLSYQTRRYLSQMCALGYQVSTSANNIFWASDLLHRVWHTEKLGQLAVDHYADGYEECLELALDAPEEAVRNSATLRYYALEVYAYDITLPGEGCSGDDDWEEESTHDHDHDSTAEATATESEESTNTTATGTECHTHSNGDVHCA